MNPAYAYIYDDFLVDQRYQEILDALETRLASLGLSGRIGRLTLFRNAKELVEGFVKSGITNVVVVGNDNTLDKVLWFLPDVPVTMGYIPLAEPSDIAALLNIPTGLQACDVLSARLIETMDVGKLNDRYFLSEVIFENTMASIFVDGQYRLTLTQGGTLEIKNLGRVSGTGDALSDARDGLLEAVITPHDTNVKTRFWNKLKIMPPNETRISFKSGEIVTTQPMSGQADRFSVSGFRFNVSVVPNRLKVIMGKKMKTADVR
ncbi:MAG: diacylglycerol kinase family protein [Patescibacteria group bacterium]|jgi:diacylglycerol kinase family enzyme